MGTHALIKIKDSENNLITRIFVQWDGYPNGVGKQIQDAVGHLTVVNGWNDADTQANGMECLAATLVAAMKNCTGNVYIVGSSTKWYSDYDYVLTEKEGVVQVSCKSDKRPIYKGPLKDWDINKETE